MRGRGRRRQGRLRSLCEEAGAERERFEANSKRDKIPETPTVQDIATHVSCWKNPSWPRAMLRRSSAVLLAMRAMARLQS